MRNEAKENIKETILKRAKAHIIELNKKLEAYLIVFICRKSITHQVTYKLNKILRKLPRDLKRIALLVDSYGGDIDAAAKIVKLIRSYCQEYFTIIPFYAKSAATLLAISSDKIIMCKSGELGTTDPLVRDPITRLFVPASSIREAINFIQEIKDPIIKLSMADKMPPLLIGAYNVARKVSKQYLEEVFKHYQNKEEMVNIFTEKFLSHGYPLDGKYCKELGLPIEFPDKDLEDKIYELYEMYIDLLMEFEEKEKDSRKRGEHLIIQTEADSYIVINDQEICLNQ